LSKLEFAATGGLAVLRRLPHALAPHARLKRSARA
jgi:hypothetical protein